MRNWEGGFWVLLMALTAINFMGCRGNPEKKNPEFFTSGSKEADQRASQRMAKSEQLTGSGEGAGERKTTGSKPEAGKPVQGAEKLSLYDRLGSEQGITAIVEDLTPRVLQDPRVDWQRKSVKRGNLFHRGSAVAWQATPGNIANLKKHLAQFLALATGGPAHYEGKEMQVAHQGMNITNPEFDAAVGDLKASLDKLKIANQEQKELLAIVESTRPQIVTKR